MPDEISHEPELIPREVLFGNPLRSSPRISPDGASLAYLAPDENVLNVWVRTIGAEDDRVVTHDRDRGIRMYFWAQDGRHILYLQDVGGNENWRLYAVHLQTGQVKDLTPFENVQVRVIEHNKHFPHEMLLAMNKDNPEFHDIYHLDLRTATLKQVAKNPGTFAEWVTDTDLRVRGGLAATPDGGFDLMIRTSGNEEWKKILSWDSDDSLNSGPLGFARDNRHLYMKDSRGANTGRLVKMDLETGHLEVIAEDPDYDADDVILHPDTYEVQMVSFTRARTEWVILDSAIAPDIEAIRAIQDGDYFIISRDHADRHWIVVFMVDNGPARYHAFDRKTRRSTFLFDNKPDLNNYRLASMEPLRIQSRDGWILHGYLTLPPGKEPKHLPLVLNVHGGPWARDVWGYDPEAQWFANRGYACLQINYRGSTGYGKAFLNAAIKEWGARMHDDLVDAVQWAVGQGLADPKKMAIYGGSYGGYAALVGATFTPDLFCCAVDIVGPSNLITMIKTIPPYWSTLLAIEHKRVGNPDTDAEFLESRSPLFRVDQIKIPILIAHGANDPRVKQSESEQIVEAMKKKGIPYEYLLFPDEGHGFAKPENRIKFYAAAERFLARHLGGRFEKGDEAGTEQPRTSPL